MGTEQLPVLERDKQLSTTSVIEGNDGRSFSRTLYNVPEGMTVNDIPGIQKVISEVGRIAVAAFPHWTDKGKYFIEEILPNTLTLSVIKDRDGAIVGFNRYTLGEVEGINFLYSNYVGIDPAVDEKGKTKYRRNGLMEKTSATDMGTLSPDVLIGCTAVHEIIMAITKISEQTGRVMYPNGPAVPPRIGKLGAKIYGKVNGKDEESSVNVKTLIRQGKSSYARGDARLPLMEKLNLGVNEAVVYLSISKSLNSRLNPK
jgi:hypothetical protein